ncbi:MAG: RluA family pseudouridine synthase [bacterium]
MQKKEIEIIFEDDNILVINKPAGLSAHHDGHNKTYALTDWILENYPEIHGVGEEMVLLDGARVERPGIVHRLDRDTSGVMVIAKNQKTFEFLKMQFHDHTVQKTYRALLIGEMKDLEGGMGKIEVPIGRSRKDPRLRVAHPKATGKQRPALTYYKILVQYAGFTYVEAYPKTGRTHQIRAHFKYLNHPVVGDQLYAPGRPCPKGLTRQALHAYKLELTLPGGEKQEFIAELPKDIGAALATLETL